MDVFDFSCGLACGFLLAFLCYLMMFLFWLGVEGSGENEERN